MLTCLILIVELELETSFFTKFYSVWLFTPFWNIWRFAQNYVLHRLSVQAEFRFRTFGYTGAGAACTDPAYNTCKLWRVGGALTDFV